MILIPANPNWKREQNRFALPALAFSLALGKVQEGAATLNPAV